MVNISILNLSQPRIIFIVLKFKSEGVLAKLHCCDFFRSEGNDFFRWKAYFESEYVIENEHSLENTQSSNTPDPGRHMGK